MTTDLTLFDYDSFSVRFGGPEGAIAVETLSETLLGFEQALRAINEIANPESHLEIYIDGLQPGSVKIGLKLRITLGAAGLAAVAYVADVPKLVIVEVFAKYLSDQLTPPGKCHVDIVFDGKVSIKGDNCDVTMSPRAYQLIPQVQRDKKVRKGVKRAIDAARGDPAVESLSVEGKGPNAPKVEIPRSRFDDLSSSLKKRRPYEDFYEAEERLRLVGAPQIVPGTRIITERVPLTIIKAVLKRGKRKWQFNWNGIKVSAPIKDPSFFDALEKRDIALYQGDALDAELTIGQRYIQEAKVWENTGYAITKVYAVTLGETQATMNFSDDARHAS